MTDDAGWADLHAEMPLAKLLAGDDQQQTLQDFVRAALVEIKEAGIDDAIRSICGDTAQGDCQDRISFVEASSKPPTRSRRSSPQTRR